MSEPGRPVSLTEAVNERAWTPRFVDRGCLSCLLRLAQSRGPQARELYTDGVSSMYVYGSKGQAVWYCMYRPRIANMFDDVRSSF